MQTSSLIRTYLSDHVKIAMNFPISDMVKLVDSIVKTYHSHATVFTLGNGGDASIAEHFASDLKIHPFTNNERRLKVHCLNESNVISRISNDIGYGYIFTEQLKNYTLVTDDLVIAFSTSGNSLNVVKALEYVARKGVSTFLIGGRDGGKAKDLVNLFILVPSNNIFHIEDFQASIAHMVTGLLKEAIHG